MQITSVIKDYETRLEAQRKLLKEGDEDAYAILARIGFLQAEVAYWRKKNTSLKDALQRHKGH